MSVYTQFVLLDRTDGNKYALTMEYGMIADPFITSNDPQAEPIFTDLGTGTYIRMYMDNGELLWEDTLTPGDAEVIFNDTQTLDQWRIRFEYAQMLWEIPYINLPMQVVVRGPITNRVLNCSVTAWRFVPGSHCRVHVLVESYKSLLMRASILTEDLFSTLAGRVVVRRASFKSLVTRVLLRNNSFASLVSRVSVVQRSSTNLISRIKVRLFSYSNLVVRVFGLRNLFSLLYSSVVVRGGSQKLIVLNVLVRKESFVSLVSRTVSRRYDTRTLYCTILIRKVGSVALPCWFICQSWEKKFNLVMRIGVQQSSFTPLICRVLRSPDVDTSTNLVIQITVRANSFTALICRALIDYSETNRSLICSVTIYKTYPAVKRLYARVSVVFTETFTELILRLIVLKRVFASLILRVSPSKPGVFTNLVSRVTVISFNSIDLKMRVEVGQPEGYKLLYSTIHSSVYLRSICQRMGMS